MLSFSIKTESKNLPAEETAEMLETDISVIQQIYDIKAANPQYGEIEIFEAIQQAKTKELGVM